MNNKEADSPIDSYALIEPYIEKKCQTYESRTPPAYDRSRKIRTIGRKFALYFKNVKDYKSLNSLRLWREFQRHSSESLSEDSARVFTQDVNSILELMHEDGKIGRIKLKITERKFSSSEGYHIELLLDFTSDDIKRLWKTIKQGKDERMALLFLLVLCACIPVRHLVRLRASDIKKRMILIESKGLISSEMLDPGFVSLMQFIDQHQLKGDDMIFSGITEALFSEWLISESKNALVPPIDSRKLFYFSRFLIVLQGVPGYTVACIGSRNSFAPFITPDDGERR